MNVLSNSIGNANINIQNVISKAREINEIALTLDTTIA